MQLRLFPKTYAPSQLPLIFRQFSFLGNMNGGCNSTSIRDSTLRGDSMTVESNSKQPEYWSTSDPANEEKWPSLVTASISSKRRGKRKPKIDLRTYTDESSREESGNVGSSELDEASHISNSTSQIDVSSLPTSFGKKFVPSATRRQKLHQTNPPNAVNFGSSDSAEGLPEGRPFDICFSKRIKSYLTKKNLEKWVAKECSTEANAKVLRPGMVLLKACMSLSEQIEIVNKCQELGLGPGGFYQPCYRDGAKLRLQMMCLGLNWDPETRKYEDNRPFDGSEPPRIPHEFSLLVERAIQDSQGQIEKELGVADVEDILPSMFPDICIVNFYSTTGRLGLHQDRDETKESLSEGLPVVSFSVGDSAKFLYGDQRNVDRAEKVLLESGDVVIFGGKSRHIFHGVQSIIPNSAPHAVLEETMLRPGRLNLTFRKY